MTLSSSVLSGLVAPSLQAMLLVILGRRRLYVRFPVFCAYTVYSVLITGALWFSVSSDDRTGFVLYWISELVYGALALLAINEVFKEVLEFYWGDRWVRWITPLALLALGGVSIGMAMEHPLGPKPMARFAAAVYAFMPGVLLLESLIFLICLLLAFRRPFPLNWGRYRLGIMAGFGVAACASAPVQLARFNFGPKLESLFHDVLPGVYILAAIIWLVTFWREEPRRAVKEPDLSRIRRANALLDRQIEVVEQELGRRPVADKDDLR